jgi:hypothetical protein
VHNDHRDVLVEAPPRERAARVRLLLAEGWAPARILADAPYLAPEFVADGDASRDVRSIAPSTPPPRDAN